MPKVEHAYNLRIDIFTKRKIIILVINVIQQTNQYVFVSFRDGIDPQIVYKMLILNISWLNERR